MGSHAKLASKRKQLPAGLPVPLVPAREKRATLYSISLLLDCAALIGGYAVALRFREEAWLGTEGLPIIAIALPIFVMFEIARETQSVETLESRSLAIQRALAALIASALLVLALSFFLKEEDLSRVGYLVTFASAAAFIVLGKFIENFIFCRWMGGRAIATILLQDGLAVPSVVDVDRFDAQAHDLWPNLNQPHMIDTLSRIIGPYDRVIVACEFERRAAWATFLKSQDVGGEILLDRNLLHGAIAVGHFGNEDTLILSRGPLSMTSRIQKRAFDLLVAAVAVLCLLPMFLMVAILIKLDDGGPVFFRQVRVGRGNQQFRIFKFRSMSVMKSDAQGTTSTARDDSRITKFGKFLRRTSIDELPQLFNVILGHMSIVGPRPHALGSLAGENLFWEVDGNYWIRHALKPGITGLAQVRGHRGPTDTPEALRQRVSSDLEYLTNWSIGRDIIILLRTLRVVVHENAF